MATTQKDKDLLLQLLAGLDLLQDNYELTAIQVKQLNSTLDNIQTNIDAKKIEIRALMLKLGALPEK